MSNFICPVCGDELNSNGKSLSCNNNHSFDIAKSGYVNLLLSQKVSTKHHGDDKLMVNSRRDFLNKGYYNPLLENVYKTIRKYAVNDCVILDAGCGECWYTASIYENLVKSGIKPEMLAIDISKDALAVGAKRNKEIKLAVASVSHLPVMESSCDMVLSFFAPNSREEFNRVLKNGGVLVRVIPLEKHLLSLKEAVYDSVYENKVEDCTLEGFELLEKQEVREMIHIGCNEDIQNVFTMTPYYYKTSAEDQRKLNELSALNTEIEFGIFTYRKK
jgi:Methylase involved in ubiquinone/menaquinone biosynthesis